MPENTAIPAGVGAPGSNSFKEAVCIEAGRIFDSCSDKDCLEDLQVFFTAQGQSIIDSSTLVKCKSAEVLDVYLTVEPVPFNKGFYAVDMTFYFRMGFSACSSPVSAPVNVYGLAYHTKKVILFGSEGNVKTFTSGESHAVCNCSLCGGAPSNMPVASVKAVDPITLGCRIVEAAPSYAECLPALPECIQSCFDGELVTAPTDPGKYVLVTLGLFTIVTLERSVQLMIPAYDYSVPEKECMNSITTDDPCEMFRRIKFPVQEFFPENLNGMSSEDDCNTWSAGVEGTLE